MAGMRMCGRSGCLELGKPIEARRCGACGYATVAFSAARAARYSAEDAALMGLQPGLRPPWMNAAGRMFGGFAVALIGVIGLVLCPINRQSGGYGPGLAKTPFALLMIVSGAVVLAGLLLMMLSAADYALRPGPGTQSGPGREFV